MTLNLIKKIPIIYIIFFSATIYAGEVDNHEHRQHKAHLHGQAKLNILIDEMTFVFELTAPALNILGFEHEPVTDEEKEKLNEANQILTNYENIISIPDLDCKQTQAEIIAPYENENIEENDHHHEHEGEEDNHSEYYSFYSLSCENINNLEQIKIKLFDSYSTFENIDVTWINKTKSGSSKAIKEQKTINLK